MPPLIPRRRSRRRSRSGRFVLFICVLVVLAVVIGGLTQVSRQSGPYDTSMNRSFASAGGVVAAQSSVTGTDLRHLMAALPTEDRITLESGLDSIVQESGREAAQAATVAGAGGGGGRSEFTAVFSARAAAALQVRGALDGLLGMHPLPVAGATRTAGAETSTPTLLSSTEATNRLASAGALLAGSDAKYRAVRRALARAAGHARLPASAWIAGAQAWQVGPLAAQLDQVVTSVTLATTHDLTLRTVRLSPQALPTPSGAPTPAASTLSPTHQLEVDGVIGNQGSVDEPRASVQFTLTSLSSTLTSTVTRSTVLASGRSIALNPVLFAVKPGQSYRLTVAIVLPAGQTDLADTSTTQVLQIAPGT